MPRKFFDDTDSSYAKSGAETGAEIGNGITMVLATLLMFRYAWRNPSSPKGLSFFCFSLLFALPPHIHQAIIFGICAVIGRPIGAAIGGTIGGIMDSRAHATAEVGNTDVNNNAETPHMDAQPQVANTPTTANPQPAIHPSVLSQPPSTQEKQAEQKLERDEDKKVTDKTPTNNRCTIL